MHLRDVLSFTMMVLVFQNLPSAFLVRVPDVSRSDEDRRPGIVVRGEPRFLPRMVTGATNGPPNRREDEATSSKPHAEIRQASITCNVVCQWCRREYPLFISGLCLPQCLRGGGPEYQFCLNNMPKGEFLAR